MKRCREKQRWQVLARMCYKYKKFKDIPLSWIESIGSRMSVYAWNKRWANRQKGTGYRDEVE